ncbi:MAG: hypothetical protein U9P38_01240 [Campylobacterota bacterium]|nr:hypothetical protein [Campylobacterota bacterium]
MKTDTAIFDEVKNDFDRFIKNFTPEIIQDSELYILNDREIDKILSLEQLLYKEYGDLANYKIYKLSNIVKIVNPTEPSHYYKLYVREKWEQVNDQEKVLARLDGKFAKWKNRLKKETFESCKLKGIPQDKISDIMNNIDQEIIVAKRELAYIKENFDNLDVRISGYAHRKVYGAISYKMNKKQYSTTLRNSVPNILWFRELSEDDKVRTNNELKLYLDKATLAFGDIYYSEI